MKSRWRARLPAADALFHNGSLGRRILIASALQALVLLVALVILLRVTMGAQIDLEHATTTYLEEQAIGDRITAAVTRQLATAAAAMTQNGPAFREEFSSAGEDAYVEIRRYLFRDLSAPQRLQLEAMREQHRAMEVAAVRALELTDRGQTAQAGSAAAAMIAHGLALQDVLGEFLRMRQADMASVAARQATVFRYLHFGVAGITALMLLAIAVMARFLYRRLATPLSELEDRNHQLEHALEQVRDTQTDLVRTEKLGAMGRMMAGLAHELNNPLASVLGYSQLALARADDDEPFDPGELVREYIAPIVTEARRARQLIHDLLGFAREADHSAAAVPLGESMEVVIRMRAFAFEQAGLQLRVDDMADVRVRADAQRLQQTLLNLISNAYEAMLPLGAGALSISARVEERSAVVIFEDDGPGLPAPELVFEPFYTTKPVGEGTGLGLALVHRYMAEVGGSITAENRAEGGARFVLRFLLAEASGTGGTEATEGPGISHFTVTTGPDPLGPAPREARVLVVEDEAPLRDLQRRLLRRLVDTVLVAEHGAQARQILEDDADVDLVISDMKMPGGDGLDLYHWIEAERPELVDRFLFVTGHPGDGETAELAGTRADRFIYKPFDMAEYVARVAALLEEQPPRVQPPAQEQPPARERPPAPDQRP